VDIEEIAIYKQGDAPEPIVEPSGVAIARNASGMDTLRLGATWQLSADVTPSNTTSTDLTWSVVSGNVQITDGGLLSATGSAVGVARVAVAVTGYPSITDSLDLTLIAVPELVKLTPQDQATAVAVAAPVYATYSHPIQLLDATGITIDNGVDVDVTVNGDTLFITPSAELNNSTEYTVTVPANAVADATYSNLAVAEPLSWTFTTASVGYTAPTGVAIARNASGIDTLRLGATWQLSADVTPSNAISTALTWSVVSGNVEISVDGLLSTTGSAVGTARVAVAVTGYPDITDYLDVTLVAVPTQVALTPQAQVTAVAVATPVYVVYSHPIQLLTATGITVDNGVSVDVTVNGDTLFITPSAALNSSTAYTVTVPAGAVADATYSNLAIAEPLSWTFTTAEQPGEQPPTSVSTENFGLKLYPNPVRTELNISLTGEIAQVELVSLTGRKVLSRSVQGSAAYTLNLQGVAAGSYVMVATLKNGAVVTQIIVKLE
jgi:hypothetical protein